MPTRLERAHHEAGHAVIDLILGVARLQDVTIKPGDGYLGLSRSEIGGPPPEWLKKQVAPLVIEKIGENHPGLASFILELSQTVIRRREIAGPFAGRWAQLRVNPSANPHDSATDEDLADELFGSNDWIEIDNEDLQGLRVWTHDLVDRWWPVIVAVAQRLLERETLSGEEVRQIVLQHATEDELREYGAQDVRSVVARYF